MTMPKEGSGFASRTAHALGVILGKTLETPHDDERLKRPLDPHDLARVENAGHYAVAIIACVHTANGSEQVSIELTDACMDGIETARAELRAKMS